ncbi:MAG TPA: MHYT domain-containing protein [Candidatus Acidoferrum sp.]|nr:MHYT domain-containing protein [Candidatus Acidoferrum sp.]
MTISVSAALPGSYDYGEVARSVLIAIAASYAALDLAGRVTAARDRSRRAWLGGGAIAMGIGIWEMHFKGMMAYRLPVSVNYHWPTILAALLAAIVASAAALYVASRHKVGPVEALTGGVIMSSGIAGLHYLLMAAMRLSAITRYSPLLVTCSILLAISFSLIALLMAFGLREETRWSVPRRLGSAAVMGAAVSAMHYTGMAAASFFPASPPELSHAVSVSPIGNSGVVVVTLMVLVAAMVTSSVDRRAGAETTAALQEAQEKVVQITRTQAMGELAAAIAHEVNQPLTAIVTNGNFCLRRLERATANPDEIRVAITEIVNDGNRASAVISRIRGLLTKGTSHRTRLDINRIIEDVTILLRKEVRRSRVFLHTDLATDLPRVQGDPVQLQQVLINLVMNAVEAVRTSPHDRREILIRSAESPDGILVQVQDSGPGIEPELTNRIFEPFFTTKAEGIGMGLSISRSIIESSGGQLSVVSATRGALFQFTLPVATND